MSTDSEQPSTPKTNEPPRKPGQEHAEAWRPRMVEDRPFNVFESGHQGPDTVPPSPKVRDPSEDTAPLEGTRDRSDKDSLTPQYAAIERDKPRETPPARPATSPSGNPSGARAPRESGAAGIPDRHQKSGPGNPDDPSGPPNDRTTLGR
jgi:hypothetical protein